MTRRCRRTDPHLCRLGAHLERTDPGIPWPELVAVLMGAIALFLAAGRWAA